jgi:site-specific DNA-cytosine methylase
VNLVLSLFPGIGLLDRAFEEEGFCVVRGPDVVWGGDIRAFHPPAGRFDGVIGGPPCQCFSSLARLVKANGYTTRFGNLIPQFERCVEAAGPNWFLMENVPQAPEPVIAGYGVKSFLIDNSRLAGEGIFGQEQRRLRRFTFGMRGRTDTPSLMRWVDLAVFLLPDASRTVTKLGPDHLSGLAASTERYRSGRTRTLTQYAVSNSPEAKRRKTLTGGHDRSPSARHRQNAVLGASSLNAGCLGETAAKKERRKAVSGSNGGNGSQRNTPVAGKGRYRLPEACRLQGLPEDFLADSPFTADGKLKAVANGVPLPMGRAMARAVREAIADAARNGGGA